MTPSHASKGGKRYRYYVSRRLVTGQRNDGNGWRLPADRLERDLAISVRDHLIVCLANGHLGVSKVHDIERLRSIIETLDRTSLMVIASATLQAGAVKIELDPREVTSRLRLVNTEKPSEALIFTLPFTQRRRGVETRLVIGAPQPARDDILIANVARASGWREALSQGDDLASIAASEGITTKYLGEMLPFAFLSPKLVRAILDGHQPPALTTNWVRRHDLPASWADQDRIIAQL